MKKTNRLVRNPRKKREPDVRPERHDRSDKVRRGASGSAASPREKLKSLILHHRRLLLGTLKRLAHKPGQSLMTSLVIAIALGLPGFFYVGVINLQSLSAGIESTGQITVFLRTELSEDGAEGLGESLRKMPGVAKAVYSSRDQSLAEFKTFSGFGDVLDLLDENPLPSVYTLTPTQAVAADSVALSSLLSEIEVLPAVDDVMLDMRWLERLNMILAIAKNLAVGLGIALSLGVLLIVGNTIRLEIENRREEIIVVKLVGGTNAYVRRPFLYTGFWYGIFGGFLAWVMVAAVVISVSGLVSDLSAFYDSRFQLQMGGVAGIVALIGIGGALGLLGAFVAVGRHIAGMEPQ
ncbi:MAG: permease-like cell division protein FtsX [bacterium]